MGQSSSPTLSGVDISRQGLVLTDAVKSDTTDLARNARALWITASGDVRFIPTGNGDADPQTLSLPTGLFSCVEIRRIYATGTTATVKMVL